MNINNKISCIIFVALCSIKFSYGQGNGQLPADTITHRVQRTSQSTDNGSYIPTVVPVAPNAASLGIFGSLPIGHYTGIPNITIPLYEIELDGKKIPVSLSYHASGIKVAQEASWVGLGWALNAGGCITHETIQGDDFEYNNNYMAGYYFNHIYPRKEDGFDLVQADNELGSREAREQAINEHIEAGNIDIQPDNFYYNFGDHSGSMFFARADSTGSNYYSAKAILKNPKEHLDVTVTFVQDLNKSTSWLIVDGDGYKYYFGGSDNSRDINTNFSEAYSNVNGNDHLGSIDEIDDDPVVYNANQRKSITAWYLDSIVSPLNHKVVFTYRKDNIVTPYSLTEDRSFRASPIVTNGGMNYEDFMRSLYIQNNYSYAAIQQSLLDKITFPSGEINFQTSTGRKDLYMEESLEGAQKLVKLNIITNSDTLKSYNFNYEYQGNQGSYKTCRLMLKRLTEMAGNQMKPPYIFTYYHPEKLPPKYSKNIDFWGYYNNRINNSGWGSLNDYNPAEPDKGTLIPTILVYGYNSIAPTKFANYTAYDSMGGNNAAIIFGADRSPNEESMKYGVLTSIKYPTGGTTAFTYEPHIFDSKFESGIEKANIASINGVNTNSVNSEVKYFELDKNALVYFDLSIVSSLAVEDSINRAYLVIEDNYEGEDLYTYSDYCVNCDWYGLCENVHPFPIIMVDSTKATNKNYTCINLKAGKYRAYVVYNPDFASSQFSVSVDLGEIKKKIIDYGAGLRIKEIKDSTSENSMVTKKFNYKTGIITFIPTHIAQYEAYGTTGVSPQGVNATLFSSEYILGTSHSLPPDPNGGIMEYTQSEVGYSQVEEITGNNNGRIEYKFNNVSYNRGTPSKTTFYPQGANNNQPIKTIDYQYDVSMLDKTPGCYMFELPYHRGVEGVEFYIAIRFYDFQSYWIKLTKEITTEYTNQGNIITNKEYQYNANNYLPEKIITTDNLGKTIIEQQIKYPFDTGMIRKHMVNMPIETISLRNDKVVSAIKTEYKDTLSTYLPKSIYRLNTSTPATLSNYETMYSPEVFFDKYTPAGKYRELHGKDGIPVVYLWSYNDQYPIAEIKNATYNQVTNAVNQGLLQAVTTATDPSEALINSLGSALKTALPFAQVTTYTYIPLVGMASKTDPRGVTTTYKYDDLRLIEIKDTYQNTIQKFEYHYK